MLLSWETLQLCLYASKNSKYDNFSILIWDRETFWIGAHCKPFPFKMSEIIISFLVNDHSWTNGTFIVCLKTSLPPSIHYLTFLQSTLYIVHKITSCQFASLWSGVECPTESLPFWTEKYTYFDSLWKTRISKGFLDYVQILQHWPFMTLFDGVTGGGCVCMVRYHLNIYHF